MCGAVMISDNLGSACSQLHPVITSGCFYPQYAEPRRGATRPDATAVTHEAGRAVPAAGDAIPEAGHAEAEVMRR